MKPESATVLEGVKHLALRQGNLVHAVLDGDNTIDPAKVAQIKNAADAFEDARLELEDALRDG